MNMKEIMMSDLFNERKKVGKNINEIMKDKGHTKISFSKITGITRPTLNKFFNGEITSEATFKKHVSKIMESINITAQDILSYKCNKPVEVYYSNNSPKNHEFNGDAKEMLNILEDIIHLCELYY